MGKRTHYTLITPLPANIPRQLAIDMLHNHAEIIELNPLVIENHPVPAPKNAAADEYFAVWHEITERIQYIPGMGKMGSGKISFKGVFHDMPWGLQTHIYAPAGVDLRQKWQIGGNQPGEPRETRELGQTGIPADGLYLRDDTEFTSNLAISSFVKKELKAATQKMKDRLMKKAELLDAGTLQAMMDNGRLKTVNLAVRNSFAPGSQIPRSPSLAHQYPSSALTPQYANSTLSPQMVPAQMNSPRFPSEQMVQSQTNSPRFPPAQMMYGDLQNGNAVHGLGLRDDGNRQTMMPQFQNDPQGAYGRQSQQSAPQGRQFVAELSGSTYYASQPSSNLHPDRSSTATDISGSSPGRHSPNSPGIGGRSPSTGGRSPNMGGPPPSVVDSGRGNFIAELA